ncbi:MAG: tRNA threonylcarbamoyladenosine dehydratase [Spirochaetaceae bacterium]|nr:tRNA threonylcarbamoyladenosine dehydratase [Spirochaetaceae bacterium]
MQKDGAFSILNLMIPSAGVPPTVKKNAALARLALLTGEAALDALGKEHVMIFGLGGVGSWCAEALVRSGVRILTIVDSDQICVTNINRQIQALPGTIGCYKADVLRQRLLEINPDCEVTALRCAFTAENAQTFNFDQAAYVIDAIDSLSCKIALIETSILAGKTLYSSMGMACKLDPTRLAVANIWNTHGCSLARLVRQELRKRRFSGHFTTVYSTEKLPNRTEIVSACGNTLCLCPHNRDAATPDWCASKKVINGSSVTVTAAAGMTLASLVLQDVVKRYG